MSYLLLILLNADATDRRIKKILRKPEGLKSDLAPVQQSLQGSLDAHVLKFFLIRHKHVGGCCCEQK